MRTPDEAVQVRKAGAVILAAHAPINNLFHLRRDHVTAHQYRASCARAFDVWSAVAGAAA